MARRQHLTLLVVLAITAFLSISYFLSGGSSDRDWSPPAAAAPPTSDKSSSGHDHDSAASLGHVPANILTGGSIAPKLENATAKAELGRAAWKLFHTMMARFPEEPSADDSLALKTYIQLFARLYPCGDCASHFQKLLAKYPPQTSSRNAAAGWACFVHNQVNERLKKPLFDCNNIGDFYDCGCGEEDKNGKKETEKKGGDKTEEKTGMELERDGLTKGG